MIIISQDKEFQIPFENMARTIDKVCGKYNVITYSPHIGFDQGWFSLGIYSTKEKALMVMGMIKDCYLSYSKIVGGEMLTSNHFVQPQMFVLPKVFEMPLDEEVD